MSETSDFIRKVFKEGDDIRDAGLTTPEGFALQAIALNCGVYDMRDPESMGETTIPIMQDFLPA